LNKHEYKTNLYKIMYQPVLESGCMRKLMITAYTISTAIIIALSILESSFFAQTIGSITDYSDKLPTTLEYV